jgi:integrase
MAYIEERRDGEGNIRYRVMIRVKGYSAQSKTFTRKTDAKIWAQQVESEMRNGRFIKTREALKHTLNDAIDRYLNEVLETKPKNARNVAQHLNWWKGNLGHHFLADITPPRISQARDLLSTELTQKGKRRGPATIVRYMSSLSIVLSTCYREWQWIDENPIYKVTKPKEPRGRVRFLDDDERRRLICACKMSSNLYLYQIVILAISTGMRRSEILNLTWKDVDLEKGRIVLQQTKNGDRRLIPVTGLALNLLKENYAKRDQNIKFLFPSLTSSKPIDLRFAWEQVLKQAQIEEFKFHDLRHSCASYLAMSGASLAEIAEVLGHRTLNMVKRYAHLSEAHTSAVVSRMNEKYLGGESDSKNFA